MSVQAVNQHIIQRFITVYGAPATEDPKAFFAEYQKLLAGADAEIIKEASDLIIRRHTFRNWPTIGECNEAIQSVAARLAQDRARLANHPYEQRRTASPEAKARVEAMIAAALPKIAEAHKKIPVAMTYKPMDWGQVAKPAFEQRWAVSKTLQWLSLPDWWRDMYQGYYIDESRKKAFEKRTARGRGES